MLIPVIALVPLALAATTMVVIAQSDTGPRGTPSRTVVKPEAPTLGAPGQTTPHDVATLLFDTPQWAEAPAGSTLTYSYEKKTADPALGSSFDDTIKLTLDKADDPVHRSVEVRMFSGTKAKPAGPFDSTAQNPVLLLVFEENVQELSQLFKSNPRYLKNTIRKAWRDSAKIEDVTVKVGGKTVSGTRITVMPFVDDPEKDKMLGMEGMTYTVEIADGVPGQIASIDIHAPADGTPKFAETLRYQSESR